MTNWKDDIRIPQEELSLYGVLSVACCANDEEKVIYALASWVYENDVLTEFMEEIQKLEIEKSL